MTNCFKCGSAISNLENRLTILDEEIVASLCVDCNNRYLSLVRWQGGNSGDEGHCGKCDIWGRMLCIQYSGDRKPTYLCRQHYSQILEFLCVKKEESKPVQRIKTPAVRNSAGEYEEELSPRIRRENIQIFGEWTYPKGK